MENTYINLVVRSSFSHDRFTLVVYTNVVLIFVQRRGRRAWDTDLRRESYGFRHTANLAALRDSRRT